MPKYGTQRQRVRLTADSVPNAKFAGIPAIRQRTLSRAARWRMDRFARRSDDSDRDRKPAVHRLSRRPTVGSRRFSSGIFLVALQQFDRDALRSADEADADAWSNGRRLFRELHTLGLDLGGHRIDVLYRQPEMIQPLVRGHRRRVDTVTRRDRRDEHIGAAELDIDSPRAADDYAAENVF